MGLRRSLALRRTSIFSSSRGRRAISVPLTPVKKGLSRSLADSPPRRSGHVTGPDGTAFQADSAGSIPVTRSKRERAARALVSGRSSEGVMIASPLSRARCVPDWERSASARLLISSAMIFVAQRRAVLVDQRSVRAAGAHPVHEFAKASPGLTGQRVTDMPQVVNVVLSPAPDSRGDDVRNRERAEARHQVNPDKALVEPQCPGTQVRTFCDPSSGVVREQDRPTSGSSQLTQYGPSRPRRDRVGTGLEHGLVISSTAS